MPTLAQLAFGPNVSGAIQRGAEARSTINQNREQDRARRTSESLDEAFAGGIPTDPARQAQIEQDTFRTGGARAGMSVRELFQGMNAQEREEAAREGRLVATVLAGVPDQATYDRARAGLAQRGVDVSTLPEQFDPGHRDFIVNSARDLEDVLKSGEGFTLSPGQARFDAQGRPVASLPKPEGAGEGFTLKPGETRFDQRGQTVASIPPAETVDDPVVANQLRDEFVKQTDEFVDVQSAFRKVEAAARTDSGPGDIALLVGYMKIIDPGSVVREGEFATAETAGGVSENVRNLYNRVVSGERLTPELRQRFVESANGQFQTYRAGYDQSVQNYTGLAQRFNIDPANVIVDRALGAAPERVATTSAAAPLGRDISAMTLEQLEAIDPKTLSDAELIAAQQRAQELQGAR